MMIKRLLAILRSFVTSEQGAAILAQHAGHADVHDVLLLAGLALLAIVSFGRKG